MKFSAIQRVYGFSLMNPDLGLFLQNSSLLKNYKTSCRHMMPSFLMMALLGVNTGLSGNT